MYGFPCGSGIVSHMQSLPELNDWRMKWQLEKGGEGRGGGRGEEREEGRVEGKGEGKGEGRGGTKYSIKKFHHFAHLLPHFLVLP